MKISVQLADILVLSFTFRSSSKDSILSFLQEKWANWFKGLDVNRDVILSKQDAKDFVEVFENYYGNRVEEKSFAEMKEDLRRFREDLIFTKVAHKDTISLEEFLASLTEEFQTDPQGLRAALYRHFVKLLTPIAMAICHVMNLLLSSRPLGLQTKTLHEKPTSITSQATKG